MTLLSILLLQADTVAPIDSATAAAAAAASVEKISLFKLLMEGGALMIPLLLCSIIMVYVFVERLLAIRKASATDPTLMVRIQQAIETNNLPAATAACKGNSTPVARVLEKGINRIGTVAGVVFRKGKTQNKILKTREHLVAKKFIKGHSPIDSGFLI